MRPKINRQLALDLQPPTLKVTQQYYAKYQAISALLDANPEILDAVHRDLVKPLKEIASQEPGGPEFAFTSEMVLRCLIAQIVEGLSLRGIVVRIDDSPCLQRFTRIEHHRMMDFTTLDRLKNAIRPETWKRVNRLLARYACEQDQITGEALRLDTTAVETHIHWPTDSSLLWDVYRVLARLIDRVREIDADAVGDRRLHPRSAKRLHLAITRKARKGRAAETLQPLYEALLRRVEGLCAWATAVAEQLLEGLESQRYGEREAGIAEMLSSEIGHYVALGARVLDQTRRRVLAGESVPNEEKLFSLFEPHTELLKRGKAGKPIEFGHMIQIQQVREKFITDYEVFANKPVEHQLLHGALESHRALFREDPDQLAADKGYYENMSAVRELERRVGVVSIAKKGRRTPEETEREHDPLFRHAQRFRAGVEGTISFLKRVLGLCRCFNQGWNHFASTVGMTIFAHNLLILARC